MAEAVGLVVSCWELAGYVSKVVKQVKLIKDAPEDIGKKQQQISQRAESIMIILQTPGLDAECQRHLLSSSQPLLTAMHEAQELLGHLFPKGREGKWDSIRGGFEAVRNKDKIKDAFDKVLQAQNAWMGGMPVVLYGQHRNVLVEIVNGLLRAEAVGAETLASTGRIEIATAGTQEEVKEVKEVLGQLTLLTRQIYNRAVVETNQKIPAGMATNSTAIESKALAPVAHKMAINNLNSKGCNCVRISTRRTMIKARFVSQSLYDHRPDCPYYQSGDKTQAYFAYLPSWSVAWLPGLGGKSVTVGWAQSFKGGAYSIDPILRMTHQVKREDSPVFKVLDQFISGFPWALWVGEIQFPPTKTPVDKHEDLGETITRIKLLFQTGQGFPTDVDENGQSIWQTSLMMLEAALRGRHDELIPFLQELLLMLLEKGVRPDQEHRSSDYLTLKRIWSLPICDVSYQFHEGKTTAFDGFRLPLYDELKAEKYVEHQAKFESIFETTPPRTWRPLLRVHPELLDDYELPTISKKLLLACTIEEFKNGVTYEEIQEWERENNWWRKRVLLGWPEVIPYLVEAGCVLPLALEDACVTGCVEVVRALLKVEHISIQILHLDAAFECGSVEILEAVVQEMVARRDMMCELASAVLEPDVWAGFGMCDRGRALSSKDARRLLDITLDEYQGRLAEALRALESPKAYFSIDSKFSDPQTDERRMVERLSCIGLFEEYMFPEPARCELVGNYVGAIQCLLDAGFHDLDKKDYNGETLLYRTCHNYKPEGAEFGVKDRDLLWLLENSSKAQFPRELVSEHQSLVSPIFYAASVLRHVSIEALQDAGVLEQLSEVPTDLCECFCSSDGCMPHYMFLRCDGNGCQENAKHDACTGGAYEVTARDGCLHQWCEAWALPNPQKELYYAEACRLEIFERLGMKHTCCASGRRKDYIERIHGLGGLRSRFDAYQAGIPQANIPNRWPRVDDAERQEIQEEDCELKAQLDRIMHHYDKIRAIFLTSLVCGETGEDFCDSFWFFWWSCVDQILPPLGKDKCVYRGVEFNQREVYKSRSLYEKMDKEFADKREDEKEAALDAAGYKGKNFGDVVDEYFGESLDTIVFLRGRRAD
ncbi:uncharacterized protein PgNI_09187 [Pyricularia grisea]|uniref:Uncharacterized protein n=1 Tax=Pyricularia grisea TaxID=148305 RepID=A0A6P8ATK1_PYRGI|nr:uncharacterized protein PgNI_09187 [Pyricularia grisea]TLD05438.1 hypothetical protein PgNI_09187 [Pyricularia grisea]